MRKKILLASISLMGSVIGAGLFVLPHLLKEGGWLFFLLSFLFFGGAMIFLNLFFAEIILRTKEKEYFTGYVGKYLGETARKTTFLYLFPGLVGTLLVYMLMAGQFVSLLAQPWWRIDPVYGSLGFLVFASPFIFRGGKSLVKAESSFTIFLLAVILAVIGYAGVKINLALTLSGPHVFLYNLPGVIFFSLLGWNILPMMAKFLGSPKNKAKMGKIITLSLIGVSLIYFFFSLALTGLGVDIANWSQINQLPASAFYLGKVLALIGLIAGTTSFLTLGNYLKNNLAIDYHWPYWLSVVSTILSPLLLYFLGFHHLLNLMGIVGALLGAFQGWIIIAIFLKARKTGDRPPEYQVKKLPIVLSYMALALTAVIVFQVIALFRS